MSLEIRWSEPALLSLAEVLQYTMEEHGERQYYKMRHQVMDVVHKIALSPFIAGVDPISKKVGFELRGYKVISRIKIMYSIVDGVINIEYVKNT